MSIQLCIFVIKPIYDHLMFCTTTVDVLKKGFKVQSPASSKKDVPNSYNHLISTVHYWCFANKFHLSFQSSKLTHNSNNLVRELEDTEVAQLRQRRLSQPFAWHQDNEKNEKNSVNLLSEPDLQNPAEGTTPEKPEKDSNSSDVIKVVSPSTCRNSVQGQIFIADDRGTNTVCSSENKNPIALRTNPSRCK